MWRNLSLLLLTGLALVAVLLGFAANQEREQILAAKVVPSGQTIQAMPTATLPVFTSPTIQAMPTATLPAYASPPPGRLAILGRVVDLNGQPVAAAIVSGLDGTTTTDDEGHFELATAVSSQWITVNHPDYLSRTRAATPDNMLLVRLTPDDGETISLLFAGDTMFGRRFYDPNEDGTPNDGLLHIGGGAAEHLALLKHVQPLLENADVTAVNLESSLSTDPYINPFAPRPANYHPTKEFIFSTHSSAAVALRQAGVDVIDVANNHLYDALDKGVVTTLSALDAAGFEQGTGYFGAGMSEAEAWNPALFEAKGQSIAFLGCTSITYPFIEGVPDHEAVNYFASDDELKGGAARCEEKQIRAAVADAVSKYDTVVFMVHGGSEYERAPTEVLETMANAAREAGAQLVINHQTHVVSGIEWDGISLLAWSLGNFVFDQTIWPTFESNLLTVHMRRGEVVRAYVEPLMIENYLPKGVTGKLAEYVARGAAGRAPGPFVVESGAMEIDVLGLARQHSIVVPIETEPVAGEVYALEDGWWVSDFSGNGRLKLGRDLLWTGSFEDQDVDEDVNEGALWDLTAVNKSVGPDYAFEGNAGVRLQHGARNQMDMVLTTENRILVTPGTKLTLTGMVRSDHNVNMQMQLSWFPDTRGRSSAKIAEALPVRANGEWQSFRLDATAPADTVAVGPYLRLQPPAQGLVSAELDNLRLIEWVTNDAAYSPLYDHVLVAGNGEVILSKLILPGGETAQTTLALVPVE